nr:AraC family transcriptional regulator [Myroides oncorhynchi]
MVIRQKLFEQLIESKLYLNVDLTLQKLSEVLEIDKKELSEYFKESNSISFRQYINRLRVEYAVGLIKEKNKDVTVEELTSFCGFNNRLSFYRAFVQVYGFPPSALLSK